MHTSEAGSCPAKLLLLAGKDDNADLTSGAARLNASPAASCTAPTVLARAHALTSMAHCDQAVQGAFAGGPPDARLQSQVLVHVAEQRLGQLTLGS